MIAPRSVATLEESLREAHAALRLGRAATAERSLRALQAQFPGDANCQWLLGAALLDQEKVAESVAALEAALALAPDLAQARVDLARAYLRCGQAQRAREEVRRVLGEKAPHPLAWPAPPGAPGGPGPCADARGALARGRRRGPHPRAGGE